MSHKTVIYTYFLIYNNLTTLTTLYAILLYTRACAHDETLGANGVVWLLFVETRAVKGFQQKLRVARRVARVAKMTFERIRYVKNRRTKPFILL